MKALNVELRSTFGKCFGGAFADFIGEGVFDFPANETLKAGDWQYRIYEDGVKDKVASNAGDLMKALGFREQLETQYRVYYASSVQPATSRLISC